MNYKERLDKLWKLTVKTCELESTVGTWHLNDYLYNAAEIMRWDSSTKGMTKAQANLRRVLNRWVKEGKLKKNRSGTGYLGKTDFGVCHSNDYYIPGGSLDVTMTRAALHYSATPQPIE